MLRIKIYSASKNYLNLPTTKNFVILEMFCLLLMNVLVLQDYCRMNKTLMMMMPIVKMPNQYRNIAKKCM